MLGGPVVQQHIVEFIRGSGVKTDGVLDSTSANGPWTWVVPMGVAQVFVTGCAAGSGGDGGTTATNSGGGGGGGSGMSFFDFPVDVVQNASLTVTVGAKGTGGTPTVAATAGGNTTIEGVVTPIMTDTGSTLRFLGGAAGNASSGLSSGQPGNAGGKIHPGTSGGAATPTAGTAITTEFAPGTGGVNESILIHALGGTGGGGASAGSGANGGGYPSTAFISVLWTSVSEASANAPSIGVGNATRGGGGVGGNSLFGEGGNGGNGGANGTNATGYGAGGGGGGGTANGGDGSDGYLRITYWSAD